LILIQSLDSGLSLQVMVQRPRSGVPKVDQ